MSALMPQPFVLVNTANGMMILNHKDWNQNPAGKYGVGYQFLETGAFDPSEVSLLCQLLLARRNTYGNGVVALDGGSNIGAHTIAWAKLMYGWGQVFSFEAQERLYYALCGNITLNNCINARAFLAALGNPTKEGETIIVPQPNYNAPGSFGSLEIRQNSNTEFIGQPIEYSHGIPVPLLSIDNMRLPRLDLIKIDVEGMEADVLRGAQQSIEKFHPDLVIEIIKSDDEWIVSFLVEHGYKWKKAGLNIVAIHSSCVANQPFESLRTDS